MKAYFSRDDPDDGNEDAADQIAVPVRLRTTPSWEYPSESSGEAGGLREGYEHRAEYFKNNFTCFKLS